MRFNGFVSTTYRNHPKFLYRKCFVHMGRENTFSHLLSTGIVVERVTISHLAMLLQPIIIKTKESDSGWGRKDKKEHFNVRVNSVRKTLTNKILPPTIPSLHFQRLIRESWHRKASESQAGVFYLKMSLPAASRMVTKLQNSCFHFSSFWRVKKKDEKKVRVRGERKGKVEIPSLDSSFLKKNPPLSFLRLLISSSSTDDEVYLPTHHLKWRKFQRETPYTHPVVKKLEQNNLEGKQPSGMTNARES